MRSAPRLGIVGRLATLASLSAGIAACTYDFDAPFAAGDSGGGAGGSGPGTPTTGVQGGEAADGEACDNGVDDDLDGAIDCADTECSVAGFACVPAAPAGYQGP